MHREQRSPKEKKQKKDNSKRRSPRSPSKSPQKSGDSRGGFPEESPDSGILSPSTEYRLRQERLREYYKRQQLIAERNRKRVADAIALATKYVRGPITRSVPGIGVQDFLSSCETESYARRRKISEKPTHHLNSPAYGKTDGECTECQILQFREREGLTRSYRPGYSKCDRHRTPYTMDESAERRSRNATPVSICKKVELVHRASSGGLPPAPVSTPRSAIQLSPETRIPTATDYTPDSEYDTGKRNDLINRYIPLPKKVHFKCRQRSRMFMYSDKVKSCNIIYHPYAVYRGTKILRGSTINKQNTDFQQNCNFGVPSIGVYYTLPDINPHLGPRHTSVHKAQRYPLYRKSPVLPSIDGKNFYGGSRYL